MTVHAGTAAPVAGIASMREAGLWVGAAFVVLVAHAAIAFAVHSLQPEAPPPDATEQALTVDLTPLMISTPEAIQSETIAEERPEEVVQPVETADFARNALQAETAETVEAAEPRTAKVTEPEILPETAEPQVAETVEPESAEPEVAEAIEREPAVMEPAPAEPETAKALTPEPVKPETADPLVAEIVPVEPVTPETVMTVTPEVVPPLPEPRPVVAEEPERQEVAKAETKKAESRRAVKKTAAKQKADIAKAGKAEEKAADKKKTKAQAAPAPKSNASVESRASKAPAISPARWQSKVLAWLNRHKRYPAGAKSRREQGMVQVAFSINASGGVLSVRITRSSGNPELDKAALDMVRRASPVPAPPPEIARSKMNLAVPVRFSLR